MISPRSIMVTCLGSSPPRHRRYVLLVCPDKPRYRKGHCGSFRAMAACGDQCLACAAVSCGSGDWQQGEGTGGGQVRSAYSCFWQVQVHIVGGLAVSGQGRSAGADLLVAGGEQKRRGAGITSAAHNIK